MTAPLIAILDDEPQIRKLLAEALTEAGFRTAQFSRATEFEAALRNLCLLYTSPSPRDRQKSRMPSSA